MCQSVYGLLPSQRTAGDANSARPHLTAPYSKRHQWRESGRTLDSVSSLQFMLKLQKQTFSHHDSQLWNKVNIRHALQLVVTERRSVHGDVSPIISYETHFFLSFTVVCSIFGLYDSSTVSPPCVEKMTLQVTLK